MFDIGFWEVVVVGVVALLVIGPKELPIMMRTVGGWMGKTRHFVNAVKTEIERESYRAEELKRLLAEQAGVVERHKNIDPNQSTIPVNYKSSKSAPVSAPGAGERAAAPSAPVAASAAQEHASAVSAGTAPISPDAGPKTSS